MKIFKLNEIPDIKVPVDPNDFVARAKYETKTSIVVKFEERFPVEINMPSEPKNMDAHPNLAGNKKSLADLKWTDWQMIHIAMEKSLQEELIKRSDTRRKNDRELVNVIANKAISAEMFYTRFRIFMTWVSRLKMADTFEQIGIRNLDDFKREMHIFHTKTDSSHRVLINNFLRQFGMEPNHTPAPALLMKITGKDDLILRMKIEDDRVRLIDFSDARLRMAQLQAAENLSQQNLLQQQLTDWTQKLHAGPTESQRKIRGIK